MNEEKKIAGIYIRVSTEDQAREFLFYIKLIKKTDNLLKLITKMCENKIDVLFIKIAIFEFYIAIKYKVCNRRY